MLCLTARWVLPIDKPFIENGEVAVDGALIVYCGPLRTPEQRPSGCELRDLGDAILLPGLVNIHTHLEYTMMRGFLEDVEFFPWVRTLTAAKSRYTYKDWLVSSRLGALECLAAGITTVGDNTDAGSTAEAAAELGLRARVYQELFGIDDREPVQPLVDALDKKLEHLSQFASERVELGVSPHAPYTIRPELFRALQTYCEANGNLPTSIHLAESPAENELTERGSGPFAEMFARRGITWQAPHSTPTRYLYDLGALTPNTLAVHCVHQTEGDIDLLVKSGASVAHCPKSNAKLGAGIAPFTAWLGRGGFAVGLGTDSAVSNNTLDIFEEMRFGLFAQRASSERIVLSAQQMVEVATLGGARALGWEYRIGTLTPGKRADITAVRLDALHVSPATDPYAALVYSARADDVCLTMVDGRILYEDGCFPGVDAETVRSEASELRQRIASEDIPMV